MIGALDFLGDDNIRCVLFFDLGQNGIALDDEFLCCSLMQVGEKLLKLFGPEASAMIMRRLRSYL